MSHNPPWILGIAASHNGAACLLHGDEIVAAVQEERLSRKKRAVIRPGVASLAAAYCLDYAKISAGELALVVCAAIDIGPQHEWARPLWLSHHRAHAIGAFATSGFEDAAVLVVDGRGSPFRDLPPDERRVVVRGTASNRDAEQASLYDAQGADLRPIEKHLGPPQDRPAIESVGALFAAVGWQIFGEFLDGAGKVMGLAAYGTPTLALDDWVTFMPDGRIVFQDGIPRRFRHAERWPQHERAYADLAASAQCALEEAIMRLVQRARANSSSRNLCYAGGAALNSIANERIFREGGFDNVFIMPAAEDSGTAIGAAYHGLWQLTKRNTVRRMQHDAVGRAYTKDEIDQALRATPAIRVTRHANIAEATAQALCEGKIAGWFQGRSELGPRALGQRSILADPRSQTMKDCLNQRIKGREAFRPFAPAVLAEEAHAWFDIDAGQESPFMLRVWPIRADKRHLVPAVTHADGTGRVQTVSRTTNPLLHALIRRFYELTGVPLVLNTSFNVAGEPIVETPEHALLALLSTGLDCCALGDALVTKDAGFRSLSDLTPVLKATSASLELDAGGTPQAVRLIVDTRWGKATRDFPVTYLPFLDARRLADADHTVLAALARAGVVTFDPW